MTTTPEVRELAAKAAAEIRRRGWHQGGFMGDTDAGYDPDNCSVCALGAINVAAGDVPDGDAYLTSARDLSLAVRNLVSPDDASHGEITGTVGSEWNDDEDRTVDDVLAVFDQIAGDKS